MDILWDGIRIPRMGSCFILCPQCFWDMRRKSYRYRWKTEHLAQGLVHSRDLPDPKTSIPPTLSHKKPILTVPAHTSPPGFHHLCSVYLFIPWHEYASLPTCPGGHTLPREMVSYVSPQEAHILSGPQSHRASTKLWPLRNTRRTDMIELEWDHTE